MPRKSGVLMHVSSLHGDYGIGSFGNEAFEFIDFLAECGFSYWQTLPFTMPDEYGSPYKSYSAFGANPYFIDLPTLFSRGLLTKEELEGAKQKTPYLCEYQRLINERDATLGIAAARAMKSASEMAAVENFINASPKLLEASLFFALKEKNGNLPWQRWSCSECDDATLFKWKFIQYEFFSEWKKIKTYANKKGIGIIGDLPMYVALDSADAWASPEQFLLDGNGFPLSVAGVPPDYFSEEGQLWGNPIYNYQQMKSDGFSFWRARMEHALTLFDGVRIDHFRALESYYKIPYNAKSAKEGEWVKCPGELLIDALRPLTAGKFIIAEDLGDITPEVDALRKHSGFAGMRVLQFAFLGDKNSPHLPHSFDKNSVAYTGTHDNNTLLGYIWELDDATRRRVFDYFGCSGCDFNAACEKIIKSLFAACADTVIFPIQDLLVYGSDTRMNTPGKALGNWGYRITKNQLYEIDRKKYRLLNELYGR